MALGVVNITEQDGRLGTLPAGANLLAIVGPANSGAQDSPLVMSRTKDVIARHGGGPLVHAACYAISSFGIPVCCVRSGATAAATEDTIDVTGVLGSSVVTYGADTTADDDYELWFQVVTGGTVGTAGITYQWSLDGGRTPSPITALGTATTFVFPNSGGVGFAFAAGTLLAGDTVKGRTHAPKFSGTDVGNSLTALRTTSIPWGIVELCGDIDSTIFDAIETAFGSGIMPKRTWIGHTRLPLNTETGSAGEATYLTALNAIFSAKATTHGVLCAGGAKITSGADFRKYRRPPSHAIAPFAASVKAHIDLADVNLGSLPGVDIRDINGNVDEHDERINPGLDDARFCVLTTNDEVQGVYVANPNLLSASGSDFKYLQHRRVMNIARSTLQSYFTRVLSRPIRVYASGTRAGKILESEAVRIENGASAALSAALMAEPMVSGGGFASGAEFVHVSRDDLLLSTFTLSAQASIVPLSYPKTINIEIGFTNPALQIRQG
jgi:hypothetical protein